MTKDKDMNCDLQILPLYYFSAVELTKDKRYWDAPKHVKKWLQFFGSAMIDKMKELGQLHDFLKIDNFVRIMGAVGIINTDIESERVRAALCYENFCKSAQNEMIRQKIREQELRWFNLPQRPDAEAEIKQELEKFDKAVNQ